ncbi:hypothetical protein FB451DRAFT_1361946 [Mycena latifolia]|nr:hypothetical protein FB451DRAFT_1361946 [Mycena latifolia]
MRAVQARLHDLGTPNAESPTEEGGRDLELHRQIAILTELERLRAMGAEEPPPYSLQRKSTYMYGAQVLVVVVAGAKHWDQNALRTVQAEPSQQSPVGDHQVVCLDESPVSLGKLWITAPRVGATAAETMKRSRALKATMMLTDGFFQVCEMRMPQYSFIGRGGPGKLRQHNPSGISPYRFCSWPTKFSKSPSNEIADGDPPF